ncbi:hypothetical protein [Streptomyces sp. NWU49]|nr:hypothetical protein [Streptomyces sp. NWU49]
MPQLVPEQIARAADSVEPVRRYTGTEQDKAALALLVHQPEGSGAPR